MKCLRILSMVLVAAAAFAAAVPAGAQVIVHGTRQIFPGAQREITIRVENTGPRASLIQAWTDDGDKLATPENARTPFVLRPPVFRLDPGKSQAMRLLLVGQQLPQDRESMYWLNVLDIPPAPKVEEAGGGNYLQFSLRTRLKLIYRPESLGSPAPEKTQWSLIPDGQGWALQGHNPTAHYVNLANVSLRDHGVSHESKEPVLIPPMGTASYPLPSLKDRPVGGNAQIEYINDQGGIAALSLPLSR